MILKLSSLARRGYRMAVLSLASCILAAACDPAAAALKIDGRVVGVSDGDTITVLDQSDRQHRIRLMGIDAPESSQAHGKAAKAMLSQLVFGRNVTVIWTEKDRYSRILGVVWLDNKDVNLDMVVRGYAWHYKRYAANQAPQDRDAYGRAEAASQSQRLGLWRDASPVPPWEFRKDHQSGGVGRSSSPGGVELADGLLFLQALLGSNYR